MSCRSTFPALWDHSHLTSDSRPRRSQSYLLSTSLIRSLDPGAVVPSGSKDWGTQFCLVEGGDLCDIFFTIKGWLTWAWGDRAPFPLSHLPGHRHIVLTTCTCRSCNAVFFLLCAAPALADHAVLTQGRESDGNLPENAGSAVHRAFMMQ